MRILFASPEVYPLAKTGGLADVSAALAAELSELGHDVRIVMPGYPAALDRAVAKHRVARLGSLGGIAEASLVAGFLPDRMLPVWLVDCPELFQRAGGPYGDAEGRDWPDNAERFALLCHAVARLALDAAGMTWRPDVVHGHDWHLGPAMALIANHGEPRPATVFTIHNLAFQGTFPVDMFPRLGLPSDTLSPEGLEFYGRLSFIKAGIRYADRITTVSPSYAREILTPEFGCGLDGLLRARAADLTGILNGVDYDTWSPDHDRDLPASFSKRDLSGKPKCKSALQSELELEVSAAAPLIGYMSRLTEQKMADLLPAVAPHALAHGAQLAIVGEGDRAIENALGALPSAYEGRVAVRIGYEESLARRLLAGADMLLAPARWEPCGLTQMYAMRYGAVPIVRCVGGLGDTVIGAIFADDDGDAEATGFVFDDPSSAGLAAAIANACTAFRRPLVWREMQLRAMAKDFGWARSARRYDSLYRSLAPETAKDLAATKHPAANEPLNEFDFNPLEELRRIA